MPAGCERSGSVPEMNEGKHDAAKPAERSASVEEIWLAATRPFIRAYLPPPPAAVAELGCGPAGGHIAALLRAGYRATGVDPEAPHGPTYRQIAFEHYRPATPLDAVIASVSLHHVHDLDTVIGHIADVLAPGGILAVVEWAAEDFDEATAAWCFQHELRDPAEPSAWLSALHAEWTASGQPWNVFLQSWIRHHGLHPASAIRRRLADRFVTIHESSGPYYFPGFMGVGPEAEQAAIDAGEIRAGCLRYVGRRPPGTAKGTSRPAGRAETNPPRFEATPIGWVESALIEPGQAPRQGCEGAPPAWLIIEPRLAEAIRDLRVGDHIIVLTWLDRARRDELSTIPGDNPERPPLGVFSTRSPSRPNPIGLHRVQILAIDGLRIMVSDLEALDRTPILDIKPVLDVAER